MDSENHFLRFLRVCFFFALRKKELSQEKQKKKTLARIVSNKRRNFQCNCKLENQTSPNAEFSSSQKSRRSAKLVASENSRHLATLPLASPPNDV